MRCPNCGQENNNNLATRCSVCGSPLPVDETTGTAERVPAEQESPRATVGVEGPAWHERIGSFFGAHQKMLGIGIAASVVLVVAIVWAVAIFLNAPAYAFIEQDLAGRLPSYAYAGGMYGPDLDIPLSSISVTSRERSQTPEGYEAAGKGSPAYRVVAEAVYDDGKMRVVRAVGATYVHENDAWVAVGELDENGVSFTARAGVDEQKVLDNIGTVLQAVSGAEEPLDEVYAGGSFSIVGNNFEATPEQDTSTDDVVISCQKEGGFYNFGGNVTARFAFESGEWRLRTAEADAGVSTRSYEPLVGTWSGTMVSHESNGGSCYGAQNQPLTVTIASVGDPSQGSGQVQGTLSGLMHFHERLRSNAGTSKGDRLVEGMTFSGVISTEYDNTTGSGLNIDCTTPGNEDGSVSLLLSFGTDSDPSAVFARVTTSYAYDELIMLFVPRKTTATFTDTYLLTRTGP